MNYTVSNIKKIGSIDNNRDKYIIHASICYGKNKFFDSDLEVRVNNKDMMVFVDTEYLKKVIQNEKIRGQLIYRIKHEVKNYILK